MAAVDEAAIGSGTANAVFGEVDPVKIAIVFSTAFLAMLAGCATPAPPTETVSSSSVLSVGAPRRLSSHEAASFAARTAGLNDDLLRIASALEALVPEGGKADILMGTKIFNNGSRCGRVTFARIGGAPAPFTAYVTPDVVELTLAQDADSLEQVTAVCGR